MGFLAKGEGDDAKHQSLAHAGAACVLVHVAVLLTGCLADEALSDLSDAAAVPQPPSGLAAQGLLAYWLALAGMRLWSEAGARELVIYELAWSCNASLLFAAAALWLRRPALLCACGVLVAIDQVLWYVDIIGYLVTGKMPIKVCGYLFWPSTHWVRRLTSLHHVFFEPLVIFLCVQGGGVPLARAFLLSAAMTVACQAACRFTMPLEIPHPKEKDGKYYMNVNLCYEAFKGVKVEWIKRYDRAAPALYLPWMLWIWNLGNFVLFTALAALMLLPLRLLGWQGATFVF